MRPTTQGRLRTGAAPQSGMGRQVPPGTAGRQAAIGQSLAQDIQVSDRPVTGQGMMGMRTGSRGPGRGVHDRSYYLGLFRNKVGEITTEINKLQGQCDQYNRDTSMSAQLERTYEDLLRDVRHYEGQLADYNLALDKHRTSTDPMEVHEIAEHLINENKRNERRVDQVFEERQIFANKIKECEREIAQVRENSERKMDAMAPDMLDRYRELQKSNQEIVENITRSQQLYDQTAGELRAAEAAVEGDRFRREYETLEKKVSRLRRDQGNLREELAAVRMDPDEARERMLTKVKADKSRLEKMDANLRRAEEDIVRNRKVLADLTSDLAERRGESGAATDSKKYEVLFERDREMTGFIEGYPATKEREQQEQSKIQTTVVALLEHISEGLARTKSQLPSKARASEMRDDLTFKERQLESAASTKERLEKELQKRQGELAKINTLDEKISVELSSLREKIESMRGEMEQLSNVRELKLQADATRSKLIGLKTKYQQRGQNVRQQVSIVESKYNQTRNTLDENDTNREMEALTQKLRHYEQNIFHLREFIKAKEHETDYVTVKEDCHRMLDQLNQKVIKDTQQRSQSIAFNMGQNY